MNRITLWTLALLISAAPAAIAQTAAPENGSASVASDPTVCGIAAVNDACDLLRGQGPDTAIGYFNDVLGQTRNAAVERAIRFQLAALYKQAGRPDRALEVIKDLIASIPPQPAPSLVQIMPAETTGNPSATPTPQQ